MRRLADGPGQDDDLRDAERLRALEQRLSQVRGDDRIALPGGDKFAGANQAWRMVVELVAGLAIGFGIGFGLDRLLGTSPILLVVFIFLGFAAGVKTMLRTAGEMAAAATNTGEPPSRGAAQGQTPGAGPEGTRGTTRGK